MTKKEMVKKEETALAMPEGGWQDGEYDVKDLLIPRICVAQGTSDITKQGKAKPNDIYETGNKTILGDAKKPVNFVPLKFFKTWVHCEMVKNQPQYRSMEPYIAANANKYQYEEKKEDGTLWRHYEVLNFYVLLSDEIENGTAFPYLLSFRSSNKKKGRPLINYMARARAIQPPQPLCSMTFSLGSVLTSNDTNSWFTFDVSTAGATPRPHVEKALEWLNTVNSMSASIKHTDMEDDFEAESAPAHPVKAEVTTEARY